MCPPVVPPARWLRARLIVLGLLFTLSWQATVAAEPGTRPFRIPPGEASATLKQFAAQAEREIMFPADLLAGVKTNRVEGHFTPRSALDRLIANTGLSVVEDTRTGALMVVRPATAPTAPPSTATTASPSPVVMKSRNPLATLAAWLTLAAAPAVGATTGAVAGRVTDANNATSLPGVVISVPGRTATITTARDGTYEIAGLTAGDHQVTFSYLGYTPVTLGVLITPGSTARLDLALGGEVVQLAAFKVEGAREGQARALNLQRSSANLKNIISADAIGNFPDKNVAESLQRVPGIHTEGQRGEPRFITIRGAAPSQNSVTMDGVSILGTEPDLRTVSLDVFPTAQLAGIEIVKALTPDLDGDSIGGAILMKGKSAFDAGRRVVTVNGHTAYNDLSEKLGYRGAVSFGDILGAKRDWGVQLAYSHERVNGLEQNIESNDWTPTAFTAGGQSYSGFLPVTLLQTNVTVEKTRRSLSGAVEKKFGGAARAWVRGFVNTFDEFNLRDGLRYATGVTATGGNLDLTQPILVSPDGTFQRYTATRATMRRQIQPRSIDDMSKAISAGLAVARPTWTLDLTGAYSRADSLLKTEQGQWVSTSNLNTAAIDQRDVDYWRVNQTAGTSFFDASALRFNQLLIRRNLLFNDETMLKADASRTFNLAGAPLKLAGGAKMRWSTKSNDNNPARWDTLIPGQTLNFNDPRLGGNRVIDASYLRGRYDFGPSVDAIKMRDFFIANSSTFDSRAVAFTDSAGLFLPNLGNTYNNSLANDYTIKEDITGSYLRADWSRGPLSIVAGARHEHTELHFNAVRINANLPNTNRARYLPYERSASYDNLLPSVHARYAALGDRLVLRAAWTNTLARPISADMTPTFSIDTTNRVITGGNPNLQAVDSGNLDFTAEYYLPRVGLVSAGWFHKRLDGPIYTSTTTTTFDDGTGPQRYNYTTKLNAGRATLRGVELSYQQQLRFLPAPFDGLGLYGNLTFVDSDVDIPQRPGESFTLFKQAKSLGNAALSYQKHRINARISYSFRSQYLSELVARGTDVYFDDDHRLDAQVGVKLGRGWSVQLSANNLEDTPELQYHGVKSRQLFHGLTGRFFSVGFTWEM
jgi:TonB-dependent receptor